jgi:hypothetical protein
VENVKSAPALNNRGEALSEVREPLRSSLVQINKYTKCGGDRSCGDFMIIGK